MSDTQLREGLLWWRNTIYRELFDNAHTIYFTVSLEESLNRLQKRTLEEQREILGKNYNKKRIDGTLLALQFINSMVYAPDGKKLTRNDKKLFINQTQNQIIETYMRVFEDESQKYTHRLTPTSPAPPLPLFSKNMLSTCCSKKREARTILSSLQGILFIAPISVFSS